MNEVQPTSRHAWFEQIVYLDAKAKELAEHGERAEKYGRQYATVSAFVERAQEYFDRCFSAKEHVSLHGLRLHLRLSIRGFKYQAVRGALWEEAVNYCESVIKGYGTRKILKGVGQIAFADIRQLYDAKGNLKPVHKLGDDIAGAVSGVEVVTTYKGKGKKRVREETAKVKTWDKGAAQEKWLKLYGLANDESKMVIANDEDKPFRVEGFSSATELFFSRIARLAAGEPAHVVMELTDGAGTE